MKPSILLTLRRGVENIARTLLEQADVDLIVLYDDIEPLFTSLDIPCRRFLSFLSPAEMALAQLEARRRALAIESFLHSPGFDQRCAAMGFDPSLAASIRAAMTATIPDDFLQEIVYLDCLRRCDSQCDLRLVLVHQDVARDTRTLVEGARRLGIPSLHLLHGHPYGTVNLHDTLHADAIAVYGEESRAIYRAFGAPDDRIHLTGNPEWDIHFRPAEGSLRAKQCAPLGLDPDRPIVVYAMTFTHRFSAASIRAAASKNRVDDAALEALACLSRRHPDWQVVIRPHPNEFTAKDRWLARAQTAGIERCVIDVITSPAACIAMTDLLACVQSNLGIEAIIAGKPVINIAIDTCGGELFQDGLGPLFREGDAAVTVCEAAGIAPAIEAALLDPQTQETFWARRPETVRRFHSFADGKSTERVCRLMLDMMAHGDRYRIPVDRFPETEKALVEATPRGEGRLLALGRAARHVARMFEIVRGAEISACETVSALPEGPWDAIIVSDPMPHDGDAEGLLRDCLCRLAPDGTIVMTFFHSGTLEAVEGYRARAWAPPRSGADPACLMNGYSFAGMKVLLSRCGLELVQCCHVPTAAISSAFNTHLGQSPEIGADTHPLYGIHYSVVAARAAPPSRP
ncbi:MAG TPA: hypothetical protein PLO62_05820 [Candidatus Hydrogenedentes bacterium]|nr:hypothetical protein [Candidatus Hydrogenedentota bacterium]